MPTGIHLAEWLAIRFYTCINKIINTIKFLERIGFMQNTYNKVFCDTNILINPKFDFSNYEEVCISIVSIEELDGLKKSNEVGHLARHAIKKIYSADNVQIRFNNGSGLANKFIPHNNDNIILNTAYDVYTFDNDCLLLTDDYNLVLKARSLELPCEMFEFEDANKEIYKGYKEVVLSDEELAEHYENPTNKWGLLVNEYLLIKNKKGEIIDRQKWTQDNNFHTVSYKVIDNMYMGKTKPRNIQQELAFDLLQNRSITVKCLYGCFGSGKDTLMASHGLSLVQKGMYDKIIFVRNNVEVKNTKPVGFLKGDLIEKLLPYAMPFADHVGGLDGLYLLINQNKIELQHMGFMRGRDIKNSIIYCTEAENLTKEHVQLLIARLAEGSTLWLNGDFKQIDESIFERNNGLMKAINSLKGNKLFGCVEFNITERSESARLAELLD